MGGATPTADPEGASRDLIDLARTFLGADFDIERHFRPDYLPWRQRLATIPDGDLFKAIADGHASVVTDTIERFTRGGVRIASGQEIGADIIVTATGFELCILGDIAFTIDAMPLALSDAVTYRGMMFTGVPNMVWVLGYFRAAWTLRCDLVGDFVCRLLQYMQETGARKVTVALRPEDADMKLLPSSIPRTLVPATSCARCICCRSGAPSPSGSTRRTTGPTRTSSPPLTFVMRCSSTTEGPSRVWGVN
jgi:cation diffusion facilitator CzcD-associated flavoprotein CzcO